MSNSEKIEIEEIFTIEENGPVALKEEYPGTLSNVRARKDPHYVQESDMSGNPCDLNLEDRIGKKMHQKTDPDETWSDSESSNDLPLPSIKYELGPHPNIKVEPVYSDSTSDSCADAEGSQSSFHCLSNIEENAYTVLPEENSNEYILPNIEYEPIINITVKKEVLDSDSCQQNTSPSENNETSLHLDATEVEDSDPPKTSSSKEEASKESPSTSEELDQQHLMLVQQRKMNAFFLQRNGKGECFVCKRCKKIIEIRKTLGIHLHYCNNVLYLVCEICKDMFISRTDLAVHLNVHNYEKFLKCDLCEKVFKLQADLTKHMVMHLTDKDNLYSCTQCSKKYKRKSNLSKHLDLHGSPAHEKHLKCKFCNRKFANQEQIDRHVLTHSGKNKSRAQRRYPCNFCPKVYKRFADFERHVAAHVNKKALPHKLGKKTCNLRAEQKCKTRKNKYVSRKKIEKTSDGYIVKKPFICKMCDIVFDLKDELIRHLDTDHKKEVPIEPVNMERRQTVMSGLIAVNHKQEQSYSCKLCNSNYPCQSTLSMHMISHVGWDHFEPNLEFS